MNGPYLIMVMANGEWSVIGAWATKALAMTDVDVKKAAAAKKMGMRATPTTKWKPWKVSRGGYRSIGYNFPGRLVRLWSANSVGGVPGNNWSYIAVVELFVDGTILDKIVEAVS